MTTIPLTRDELEVYAEMLKWAIDIALYSERDVERYGVWPISSAAWLSHDDTFGVLTGEPAYLVGPASSAKTRITDLFVNHLTAIGFRVAREKPGEEMEYKFYYPGTGGTSFSLRHALSTEGISNMAQVFELCDSTNHDPDLPAATSTKRERDCDEEKDSGMAPPPPKRILCHNTPDDGAPEADTAVTEIK